MNRSLAVVGVAWTLCTVTALADGPDKARSPVRGEQAVRGVPTMNPPLWSASGYEEVWKRWAVKEKPADFAKRLRDRYGLHEAPYENSGLPMGLHYTKGLLGKGIVNDCLLCHAGRVAGQTIVGLGNASLDVQGLFDELPKVVGVPLALPFTGSHVRGTIDPITPVAFLLEFRTPDLDLQKPIKLDYFENICSDPPAWWLLKRKKTRNWNGGVDANAVRVDMANLLSPFNSAAHIKKQEPVFADIHSFILTVETPKYPFPIDHELANKGKGLFVQNCARCHGTYGPDGEYPNKVVPLKTVGTDPILGESFSGKNFNYFMKTWLAQEKGPDGKQIEYQDQRGYQAPPLDGVWATAPYFHNASVPTIYHVLNSKARPKIFTRSFGTEKEDFDAERVGWKISECDRSIANKLPAIERRRIYDTTRPGQSNAGHTFGDEFTEAERRAVIEYLKTL
ncbi:MAG: c-type cytochrome [Gemmataceae bacterium]|nr:c-type cytochrome [Gemmataceae bacterium]MCI0741096.1 c-type cytochrome [Gemmataceae bacterium]